jgi:hypothetical protein
LSPRRLVVLLLGSVAAAAALWSLWPDAAPPPLIAGLSDDGLRGAPCPARSLYEQDARKKQGVRPPAGLGERLRTHFPLGSDAGALSSLLILQNFQDFAPCPNDEGVYGARWLSPDWAHGDAYVYWRVDDRNRIIFLDGHISRTK